MEKDLGIKRNNKYWKFDNRLLIYVLMNNFYCFHINTVVVSKDIVEEIGGFDEKLTASEDLDFIYRIMLKNNLLTINNQHFQYNYGDDNIYAFCDRYNQSFEKDILNNPKYVLRISKNICCKIRLHEKMN